ERLAGQERPAVALPALAGRPAEAPAGGDRPEDPRRTDPERPPADRPGPQSGRPGNRPHSRARLRQLRQHLQGEPGHDPFFITGVDQDSLRKEVFFLAYHLHWSWSEIMDLEIEERSAFVRLLIEQIERENAQIAATRRR